MGNINYYPRVLVFSNNCFSKGGSNGRTLGNLFYGYPIENIAQFYIQNEEPDLPVSNNYYRVTDREALNAFIKGEDVGKRVYLKGKYEEPSYEPANLNKKKKNPITMIIRNIIWNSKRWQNDDFQQWIESINPEVILLQSGDSAFMLRLATEIAKQRRIPLIIYNSESYYFKSKNFMKRDGISGIFFPLFMWQYRRQFKSTIAYARHSIYICKKLEKLYNKEFNKPSTTIMNSTELQPQIEGKKSNNQPVISYLGNLGIGRHEPLIEIGQALKKINSNFYLDIYGRAPNDKVKKSFDNCEGIRYQGLIPYEKVIRIMQESDILIYVENFSDAYKRDLEFAFSTKISDSLKSGTCLFAYGPECIASIKYLKENQAACVVTDSNQLISTLEKLIKDKKYQNKFVNTALKLADKNHNKEINKKVFYDVITESLLNNKE